MDYPMDETWGDIFTRQRGNEYFCSIDIDFILDRFNLTGLNNEVNNIQSLLEILTSVPSPSGSPQSDEDDWEVPISVQDPQARHLYGLIHARFILTTRGLHKMMEKYRNCDFGRCPRALCRAHPVLPVGLHDQPQMASVKLYCPKCEDLYNPKSQRHQQIDGCYFGTSLPAMFFQVYSKQLPRHSNEQFCIKVFGFKLHENAELCRWQQRQREEQEKRLSRVGMK